MVRCTVAVSRKVQTYLHQTLIPETPMSWQAAALQASREQHDRWCCCCLLILSLFSTTPSELEAAANQLLAMCQAGLPAPASYNAVLTSTFMLMVPRRQETCGPAAIK